MEQDNLTAEKNDQSTLIAESGEEQSISQQVQTETVQTPEMNRKFADMRRKQEKERLEKEITGKARLELVREIMGDTSSLNGKEISDENDIAEFINFIREHIQVSQQARLNNDADKDGIIAEDSLKDKVNEFKSDTTILSGTEEWYTQDRADFFRQNTDFDEERFRALLEDKDFISYSDGKVGKIPLNDIYKEYNLFITKLEDLATEKARKMYLKKFSSPGSLSAESEHRINKPWEDMSEHEFEKAIQNAKKGYYSNKK